jgi:hypothetical protein
MLQSRDLAHDGRLGLAGANVVLSLAAGLLAVWGARAAGGALL